MQTNNQHLAFNQLVFFWPILNILWDKIPETCRNPPLSPLPHLSSNDADRFNIFFISFPDMVITTKLLPKGKTAIICLVVILPWEILPRIPPPLISEIIGRSCLRFCFRTGFVRYCKCKHQSIGVVEFASLLLLTFISFWITIFYKDTHCINHWVCN